MWKSIDEQTADARLDRLAPVSAAIYNSAESSAVKRRQCTEGTRMQVLAGMNSWVYNSPPGAVYWLNGMAGTGKTTIAYSLCSGLDTAHRLGASFFCSRLLHECRDVNKIVPSIAYQLAHFSFPFRCALLQVLEKDRDTHKRLLRMQFERLIVGPLTVVRDTLPTDLVVVIDALDECDDKDSTMQILDMLLTKSWTLPIKFFVCSRPEPQIRDEMMLQGGMRASARLVLHELDKGTVQADIEKYLREALRQMNPLEQQLAGLVERAGVLFIYAATAVRYIGYDNFRKNPHGRIDAILKGSGSTRNNKHKEIDELYTMILKAAIDDPELDELDREDMILVLHTVICVREPLTINTLSSLLKLHNTERVHSALRPLWSVLHVMEESELVTTLHASFPDYMFDATRSKAYRCDETSHNGALALLCFDYLEDTRPQFNICRLQSSCLPDKQVKNLDECVKQTISTGLFYACRYWAIHLGAAETTANLHERLENFLSQRLLLWMEVLNLKNCIHTGADMMWRAEDWCTRNHCSEELTRLAHDAWRYVMTFASSPVSQSTPHIYVSMLPFWPPAAPITKHYMKRTRGMIAPQGTAMARRQLSMLVSWAFLQEVQSAAMSPEGNRIALALGEEVRVVDAFTGQTVIGLFGDHGTTTSVDFSPSGSHIVSSSGSTIQVWDVQSGKLAIDPLNGHTSRVTCVKFSSDGAHIVSGSDDKTIRVWDICHSQHTPNTFRGHTKSVTSVGFSPDGTRIISGSRDRTVRIWDPQTMQTVLALVHSSQVTSVAFSPEGTRIVSGSSDKTVVLWNAHDGQRTGALLNGHTKSVTSVAFLPDGTRIVSASEDKTIRIWDLQSGETVLGPLEGHTGTVNSVAFSTRGSHLVSASSDKSITLWDVRSQQADSDVLESAWDAQSTKTAPSLFKVHGGEVTSVAFSPDSARIVSGSMDNTIYVWDVQSAGAVLGPFEGHTSWVSSVAFSPDGTRVVSGSNDYTICVWDAQSAKTVLGPFQGHTGWVTSVAFSHNSTRIVSGSDDCHICVWDAQNGRILHNPLQEHRGGVTSVAFSYDDTRIVSGSDDCTIYVWDAPSARAVLGPFVGHTSWVSSVAFSPDDTRIVSGSNDCTIRVWDARNAKPVLCPFRGHSARVTSVAFSPDGTRIVSGSSDKTIRVWDARGAKTVVGPLTGHTSEVTSVAFSPDGTRIVSGSWDMTVRIWDAQKSSLHATIRSLQASSTTSSNPTSGGILLWTLQDDGWIVDGDSKLLAWVPRDLHGALAPAGVVAQTSPVGYLSLDFDNKLLGELWSGCFLPA